ncbi:MAG TPA: hypothetical protein DDX39_08885 [Bacteroidales bacterium]|nr:MAG: hypothetical protein A2W98_06310 [Bacteroidetes bacterium GWF2_33_38]HBF88742.1 hypothetical protein [Bacteroidales bacterium]
MTDNNYFEKKEETLDIKKILYNVLNNWYLFVLSIFISLSVAYLTNRYMVPTYSVSSTILVKNKDNSFSNGVEGVIEDLGFYKQSGKRSIENEIGILTSYDIILKAIEKLDFQISYYSIGRISTLERYKTSPFIVKLDTTRENLYENKIFFNFISKDEYILRFDDNTTGKIKLKFGEKFENELLAFTIELNPDIDLNSSEKQLDIDYSTDFYFTINNKLGLANRYRASLSATQFEEKSSIIVLSIQDVIPQKGVDFLNMLSSVYLQTDLDEKNLVSENTRRFIDEQLSGIMDSLQIAESNLLNFRMNNNIINISKEGSAIFEKLERLQNETALLNIKLKYYEYLKNYIIGKNNFKDIIAPSNMGIEDPLLNSLIKSLSEYYSERNVISYTVKENTPSANLIDLKIKNAKEALIENVTNLIESTNISLQEQNKRLYDTESKIKGLPLTEQQLINIERKFELSDNLYTYLLEKRAESGIIQASNTPDNKVLDIARLSNALYLSPKRTINYVIALIIGFLIPFLIIILKDYFNNKISDIKDIENNTKVPILGTVGHNNKTSELIVKDKPKSSISESFRALRTNLQYLLREKDSYIITITSAVSGEGKTFCAINLASIIAYSNKKTVLIGLDLRKPKLHKELGLTNEIGISTYLIGKNSLDDIIIKSEIDNLSIITSGPIPPNPAELIESKKMQELLDILKKEYEYIVIDTPPVALVTDALLLSKVSDANIFVIRQNYSNKNVIKLIDGMYTSKKMENLSVLVNDINSSSYYGYHNYGYTYGYGYGNGYGYGYYEEDFEAQENWFQKLLKRKSR